MTNKLVFENLKYRWLRTALSIVAIAVQVVMVLTLVGLSRGVMDDQKKRARGIGADILVRAPGSTVIGFTTNMSAGVLPFLEKQPHVAAAAGILIQGTGFFTSVTGLRLSDFSRLSGGFRFLRGGPFQAPDDVIIDEFYATQHNLRVGDRVPILNRPWRVSGVVEPGMLARLIVQLEILQDLTSNPGKLTIIYLKLDDPSRTSAVIADLRVKLKDYQIYSMEEYTSLFSASNVPMLQEFIWVTIGLGVVVGFLVVFLSMYTAVLERTREIGVLKALGASPAYVLNLLLRETAILALCGSVLGVLLSFVSKWVIHAVAPGSLVQAIVPDWWPIAAGVAMLGALLGAAYPGLRAARQDAIEALAYE